MTFYAGLLTILIALQSPLDALADQLFWAHMIQHLLLLTVAAPLIVLGRPVDVDLATAAARLAPGARAHCRCALGTSRRCERCSSVLAQPAGAWLAFNVSLVFWHMPGPYDLTLRNLDVHVLEHTTFLLFGILFWAQVIGAAPAASVLPVHVADRLRRQRDRRQRRTVDVPRLRAAPALRPYAMLAHRPGGISALADQQIGAGIMWTAGDMPFAIAIAVLVQRWLGQIEATTAHCAP